MRESQNRSVLQVTNVRDMCHVGADLCVRPFNPMCLPTPIIFFRHMYRPVSHSSTLAHPYFCFYFSPHAKDSKFPKINRIYSMETEIPPRRKPLRLPDIDYSESGAYFITIVIHERKNLFGRITDGNLVQLPAGEMVATWWKELENKYTGILPFEFVVMPNHFHGIIVIEAVDHMVKLGQTVQWFKTMTTNEYIREVRRSGWEPFDRKLWQRNYYEHIIRSEDDFNNAVLYIQENPNRWDTDDEYVDG